MQKTGNSIVLRAKQTFSFKVVFEENTLERAVLYVVNIEIVCCEHRKKRRRDGGK